MTTHNCLTTTLSDNAKSLTPKLISAAKYYYGVPDGKYFTTDYFDKDVIEAKKAYITLNTIIGNDSVEKEYFLEGKLQIPGLITSIGIKKSIELFSDLYLFGLCNSDDISTKEVHACKRASELKDNFIQALTSTTKLSIDEIFSQGYGDKVDLAICHYILHEGAIVFDMEKLKSDYLKPHEREVLLLIGNQISVTCLGDDKNHIGKDGNPGKKYLIDVYAPQFDRIIKPTKYDLESIVFDEEILKEEKRFFEELNSNIGGCFPQIPEKHFVWKDALKQLIYRDLQKITL